MRKRECAFKLPSPLSALNRVRYTFTAIASSPRSRVTITVVNSIPARKPRPARSIHTSYSRLKFNGGDRIRKTFFFKSSLWMLILFIWPLNKRFIIHFGFWIKSRSYWINVYRSSILFGDRLRPKVMFTSIKWLWFHSVVAFNRLFFFIFKKYSNIFKTLPKDRIKPVKCDTNNIFMKLIFRYLIIKLRKWCATSLTFYHIKNSFIQTTK